jgi:DNA (cytosine-5)-methyltransferase 1
VTESRKFIDLFAGIGGMRIPFDSRGWECVFTSEIDKWARATYAENFGIVEAQIHGDVTKIDENQVPDHDLLVGGFPCQPFSHAGHKRGFEDTRGTLFFDVQRIIKRKRPKVVLLENVRGLLSHDKGHTFGRIVEILSAEYVVHHALLNARDYGLPQNRIRIYIVAIRSDLDGANDWKFPAPTADRGTLKVQDILEDSVDPKLTISDRLWASHQARKARHLSKGNGFGYRLVNGRSEFTATISARYYKDGSEILLEQEGKNPRKLSPREAARLQGFPETFKPSHSNVQAYKQFGNAVPVNVIDAIASEIDFFIRGK